MLANGKFVLPTAVSLTLTGPTGRTSQLHFFDRQHAFIAGRLDDFPVALPAGASYAVLLRLNQLAETNEFGIVLAPGHYRVVAQFGGRGVDHPNSDMQGLRVMNFWKGTVRSGTVEFDVP
jgi:hypothetical protein